MMKYLKPEGRSKNKRKKWWLLYEYVCQQRWAIHIYIIHIIYILNTMRIILAHSHLLYDLNFWLSFYFFFHELYISSFILIFLCNFIFDPSPPFIDVCHRRFKHSIANEWTTDEQKTNNWHEVTRLLRFFILNFSLYLFSGDCYYIFFP